MSDCRKPLPALRGAGGEARFDSARIDFRVRGGRLGRSEVSAGSVRIDGLGGGAEKISIDATVDGAVQEFLRLIDRKALASVKALGGRYRHDPGAGPGPAQIGLPAGRYAVLREGFVHGRRATPRHILAEGRVRPRSDRRQVRPHGRQGGVRAGRRKHGRGRRRKAGVAGEVRAGVESVAPAAVDRGRDNPEGAARRGSRCPQVPVRPVRRERNAPRL